MDRIWLVQWFEAGDCSCEGARDLRHSTAAQWICRASISNCHNHHSSQIFIGASEGGGVQSWCRRPHSFGPLRVQTLPPRTASASCHGRTSPGRHLAPRSDSRIGLSPCLERRPQNQPPSPTLWQSPLSAHGGHGCAALNGIVQGVHTETHSAGRGGAPPAAQPLSSE